MSEEPKKTSVGIWCTVALLAMIAYPLSFRPACRLCEDGKLDGFLTWVAYRPMKWMAYRGPGPVSRAIWWWVRLFRTDQRGGPAEPLAREWQIQHPGMTSLRSDLRGSH